MALVKKLQPGGTIVSDDKFDKFLEEQSKNIKKNSFQTYANEAESLRTIYRTKGIQGLKNAFEFDDFNKTYTVKDPLLNNFKGLEQGSNIKTDVFGRIKLESPESARTYLGNVVQQFLTANPVKDEEKKVYKPLDLATEITNRRFGENVDSFTKNYHSANEEDRWNKYIVPTLKESIVAFKQAGQGHEHKYLDELNQIETLINTPKFDRTKVIDLLNSSGQNTNGLFRTKDEIEELNKLEALRKQQQSEQDEQDLQDKQYTNFDSILGKIGLDSNSIKNLFDRGFNFIEKDNNWTNKKWLQDYLTSNPNVKAIKNTLGKHVLVDKNGLHDKIFNDLAFPEYYGKAIQNVLDGDKSGLYSDDVTNLYKSGILTKPQELIDSESGKVPTRGVNIENSMPLGYVFNLTGNVPKEFANAKVHGFPTNTLTGVDNTLNKFGEVDYSKSLKIVFPNNKVVWLNRGDDNTYSDKSGKIYNFGLKKVAPINYKKALVNPPSLTRTLNKDEAHGLYKKGRFTKGDVASLLKWAELNPSDNYSKAIISTFKKKDGGGKIDKFQFGGGLTKYDNKKVEEVPSVKEYSELKGSRLNDNSSRGILDKVILGLNAASLAPGVIGATAAGINTGFEAYRDFSDGVEASDFGNLAMNIALTGASFLGLGALGRGLKVANKSVKITKELKDVDKLTSFAKEVEGGEKYIDALKTLKKSKITNLSEVGKTSKKTEAAIKNAKEFAEILTKSKQGIPLTLAKESVKGVGSGISKGVKFVGKTSQKFAAPISLASIASGSYQLANDDIVDKIKTGNVTTADLENIGSVLLGTKLLTRSGKMMIGKKFGTIPGTKTEASLVGTIKDKEVVINDKTLIDKFNSKNPLTKKDNLKEVKTKFLKQYNESIPSEEQLKLKDLKDMEVEYNKASSSNLYLKTKNSLDQDQSLQNKAKKWAKKYNIASEKPVSEKPVSKKQKGGSLEKPYSKDYSENKLNLRNFGTKLNDYVSKNSAMLGDLSVFGITNNLNKQNAILQKRALMNSMMPSMVLPKVMLSVSNPMLSEHSKAATSSRNLGQSIAKSTSNLNLGINAKLESEKNANDILLQGSQANANYIHSINDKQANLNADINAKNLQAVYQTMAGNKEIGKQIALVDVNKNLIDASRISGLNDAIQNNIKTNKYFAQRNKIIGMYKDPEYLNDVKEYQNITNLLNSSDYSKLPEYAEWKQDPYNSANQIEFTKSKQFQKLIDKKTEYENNLKNKRELIALMNDNFQIGNYAKGGSIQDKIELEREKIKGKKELEILRQHYRRLLENDKFLQKSMIKIFK